MTETLQRFLRVWIVAATTALVSWSWIPQSFIDRAAFAQLARWITPSSFTISGKGSHHQPWQLHSASVLGQAKAMTQPAVIALNDDLSGFFQSSPHSAIDIAVIFQNIQRLGFKKIAASPVLAWDQPDPIGLAALEKTIASFDSLLLAAPLSRGPVSEPIPPSFRKASIALDQIIGNTAILPVVNRLPIPNIILSGPHTNAGFLTLESEPPIDAIPLMARWDDRVVFAFPLLAALQQMDISPHELIVHLGKSIQFGTSGPSLPINEFGYFTPGAHLQSVIPPVPAEHLIDAEKDLFKGQASSLIFSDYRSRLDPTERHLNAIAPLLISNIQSAAQASHHQAFARAPTFIELPGLLALSFILALASSPTKLRRCLLFIAIMGLVLSSHCIGMKFFSLWLPGASCVITIAAAWVCASFFGSPSEQNDDRIDFVRYSGPSSDSDEDLSLSASPPPSSSLLSPP